MDFQAFRNQVDRLSKVYGGKFYPEERIKLLWSEVKDFDIFWFTRVVDEFIGCTLKPPMLPEFRLEISKHRERLREKQKQQEAKDANAWRPVFSGEDISTIVMAIKSRMNGKMNDQDYEEFKSTVRGINVQPLTRCKTCEDEGLVFHADKEGYEFVYRCNCREGMKQPQSYPLWKEELRKEKFS